MLGSVRSNLKRRLKRLFPRVTFNPVKRRRAAIAAHYLRGTGIEIGALHGPLIVPRTVRVRYVDRMRSPQLRQQYPELSQLDLVKVDIVDDGETLATIPDGSQDFVIANHFIEHCQDPIGALTNHFRVLKAGGILYLAVPDKRFTFDKDRPVTPISHLYQDHEIGPAQSRMQHFEDWVRLVDKVEGEGAIREQTRVLMEKDYSIHYHVWTQLDFLEFLLSLRDRLSYDIETMLKQADEFVFVLRKTGAGT